MLIVVMLIIGVWEAYWRLAGFTPGIADDWRIWGLLRRQANGSSETVALIGASRILLGLDPAILEERINAPVYMLAIDGSNPLPVLENLVEDEGFNGRIICSLTPYWLATDTSTRMDRSAGWLRSYRQQKLSSRVETRLSLVAQSHLVFRNAELAPTELWRQWRKGESINPPYAPLRPDRYRPADYSKIDLQALRRSRIERSRQMHAEAAVLERETFQERTATIASWVRALGERGGSVAFVRFPSCGAIREIERQTAPQKHFWQVFADKVEAVNASVIHFEEYPELSDFTCMDGSHLQHDDAVRFTRNLEKILGQKGFWAPEK